MAAVPMQQGFSTAPGKSPSGVEGVEGADGVDGTEGVDGVDGIDGAEGGVSCRAMGATLRWPLGTAWPIPPIPPG